MLNVISSFGRANATTIGRYGCRARTCSSKLPSWSNSRTSRLGVRSRSCSRRCSDERTWTSDTVAPACISTCANDAECAVSSTASKTWT